MIAYNKDISGVSPSVLVESLTIPALRENLVPSMFNGLVVTIFMVDPIPPDGNELLVDLYSSTAATPGEAMSPKLKDLPPPHCPGTVGI